ncbi:hypothetical protein EH165_14675 [Nakamurella antarctica]|uniref:Uncharacterized protein n=1 Tax=Nakamurella antarctica TaxID=1902245 RepID=A0A3G8ZPX2_9ACTN|nr:hypothetical protein [Nakamurella antarctica]AZI59198.1 hypothetical protein EH165_14675 [Nakamurella antarctica]
MQPFHGHHRQVCATDPEAERREENLYPGSNIVRNNFALTDFRELRAAEYGATTQRELKTRSGEVIDRIITETRGAFLAALAETASN